MYIPVQCYGLHTIPLMCYTPCCNLSPSILFGILCIYICVSYTTMCCMLKFYVFLCTLSEMTNKTCACAWNWYWLSRQLCWFHREILRSWPVTSSDIASMYRAIPHYQFSLRLCYARYGYWSSLVWAVAGRLLGAMSVPGPMPTKFAFLWNRY